MALERRGNKRLLRGCCGAWRRAWGAVVALAVEIVLIEMENA